MATLNLVFLKVIQNLKSYLKKDHIPFELWVRRIAVNTIIDEYRKHDNYKRMIDTGLDAHEERAYADEEKEFEINEEQILTAVNQLPEMNRAVFNLYVIDGYKHEEIAGLLGISTSTSKVHLFRARKTLQNMLGEVKKRNQTVKSVLS
jgi:RNA polymerase sigma-70 factor (ECF subfamily)